MENIDQKSVVLNVLKCYNFEFRYGMIMKSPLLLAILNDKEKIVKILLSKEKIDLNFGWLNIGGGSNL